MDEGKDLMSSISCWKRYRKCSTEECVYWAAATGNAIDCR